MKTGLGNSICASDEPSELKQILSEIWDICKIIIQQRHAVAQTDILNLLNLNKFSFFWEEICQHPIGINLPL